MDRKLVVHALETKTVRHIFRKYVELGSVRKLKEAIDAAGMVSKVRKTRTGRIWGGKPFARGALYAMLQNRIYLGKIDYKGQAYPGKHEAIVDPELWEKVQKTLAAGRVARGNGSGAKEPGLLAGLLYDGLGERMTPTHAVKKGRRYRYYVPRSLIPNPKSATTSGRRIPAGDIEQIVTLRLTKFLSNAKEMLETTELFTPDGAGHKRLIEAAASLASDWHCLDRQKARDLILAIISRIDVHQDRIEIQISLPRLASTLRGESGDPSRAQEEASEDAHLTLAIPARLKRTGMEMKMLVEGDSKSAGKADRNLVRLIVKAHALREKLESNGRAGLGGMTQRFGSGRAYYTRLLRLSFLAPDITKPSLRAGIQKISPPPA